MLKRVFNSLVLVLLILNVVYGYQQQPSTEKVTTVQEQAALDELSPLAYTPKSEMVMIMDVQRIVSSPIYPNIESLQRQLREKVLETNPDIANDKLQNFMAKAVADLQNATKMMVVGMANPSPYITFKGEYDVHQLISSLDILGDMMKVTSEDYLDYKIYTMKVNPEVDGKNNKKKQIEGKLLEISFAVPNHSTLIFSSAEGIKEMLDVHTLRKPGVNASNQVMDLLNKTAETAYLRMAVLPINKKHAEFGTVKKAQIDGDNVEQHAEYQDPFKGFYGSLDLSAGVKGDFHVLFINADEATKAENMMKGSILLSKSYLAKEMNQQPELAKVLTAIDLINISSTENELKIGIDIDTALANNLMLTLQTFLLQLPKVN